MNLELSISEDGDSIFNAYAEKPCDQVVGESYDEDIFELLAGFIAAPGRYRIRSLYFGVESPWVDVDILP